MTKIKCSQREAILAYRRVLRLTNVYLRKQKQDLLVTDGRGLMTWGEIRHHIREEIERLRTRANVLDGKFYLYDYCANDIRDSWREQARLLREQADRLEIGLRLKR